MINMPQEPKRLVWEKKLLYNCIQSKHTQQNLFNENVKCDIIVGKSSFNIICVHKKKQFIYSIW